MGSSDSLAGSSYLASSETGSVSALGPLDKQSGAERILSLSATGAMEVRSLLNNHFQLAYPADRSLGTAQAVKTVRQFLKSCTDPQLQKDISYLASASDVYRHLTCDIITAMPSRLAAALAHAADAN